MSAFTDWHSVAISFVSTQEMYTAEALKGDKTKQNSLETLQG